MRNENDKAPAVGKSLLAKQMKILGLAHKENSELDVKDEHERIESLSLPPLVLPKTRSLHKPVLWGGCIGFAVAAALALMVWPKIQSAHDMNSYSMKGLEKSQIQIFHKRNDVVERFIPGQKLLAGDYIRVSLTAGNTGIAYLTYFDHQHQPLVVLDKFFSTGLAVKAGEKIEFPGSVKLTGENQGETVVVVLCTIAGQKTAEQAGIQALSLDLQKALIAQKFPAKLTIADCQMMAEKLR